MKKDWQWTKPNWTVRQVIRTDRSGLIEDICVHGVGHPNKEWLAKYDPTGAKMTGVHGCDRCCSVREK